MHQVTAALRPALVHVHGLQFAWQAWQLKNLSNMGAVPILLQDHANVPPRHWLNRLTLRWALSRIKAVSFAAEAQARPWREGGFLRPQQPVFELMEGSSRFNLQPRLEARARTGMTGDPVCLWVGRLNANKDPLTVLSGFKRALTRLPDARLTMVYSGDELLSPVQSWLTNDPSVFARVTLLGRQPHAALEAIYNSADFFLLGSHHEASGYAAIEALSCGVVPILTDIPSFRVLTKQGTVGGLWPVGDAQAMAQVLKAHYARLQTDTPDKVRAFFDANFRWEAIGKQAMAAYRRLLQ
jgi:glycosyltransferase involved in cell wall biosynthesis